jgi:hypothetical protein
MASISKEILTRASPVEAWEAVRDVGALHTRLVPGFVIATELVPGGRRVSFGNGLVLEEPIVDFNDDSRRLVWTAVGGTTGLTHYNAAVQVFRVELGGSRIIWTVDLLPHEAAPGVCAMMEGGVAAMTRALGAVHGA